jgi:ElaA protein
MTQWHHFSFDQLTVKQLYDILKLRQDVFVVEQRCIYRDLDDADQKASHLFCYSEATGTISAYARLFNPGVKYPQAAIGRVVIHPSQRGAGLGRDVMQESINRLEQEFPTAGIKLSAQEHLERFYRSLGFVTQSAPYDDDGIMHIDMIKPAVDEAGDG